MSSLTEKEAGHLVRLVKQKYISPFKIIYMLDQKEADYFKSRNQNAGCCTASEITIKSGEQTHIQKELFSLISFHAIKNILEELFQYCEDRYRNISQKGEKDQLRITTQVQKYLLDNILAESVNKFLHAKLVDRLAQQSKSLSSQIGLLATPGTWSCQHPHTPLQLFEPRNVSELLKHGHTIIQDKLRSFSVQAFEDLVLLQKDGRFQQILWRNSQKLQGNETKILRNPMRYGNLQGDSNKFGALLRLCLLLQSVPFELNMRANCYLTISDAVQAYYYKCPPLQAKKKLSSFKYEILVPVGASLEVTINQNVMIVKEASILVVSSLVEYGFKSVEQSVEDCFVIRSMLNQAQRLK